MGRRSAGGGRRDATLRPPENCTSPLRCCYGDVFRLSTPVTAAALAFFQATFFALKNWSEETFLDVFLNLPEWQLDLDGKWMFSLSNIGSLVASRC